MNIVKLPGFCDVHVHFREPGYEYKETMETGILSAMAGGYSDVCTMPNLKPVPDSIENVKCQTSKIPADSLVNIYPYGSITKGQNGEELSDMEAIAPFVIAFSDDGRGVQSDKLMRAAMLKAKNSDKIIVAHCEVNDLLDGGYIHKGEYAKTHGHKGISSESEWKMIERDLRLVKETGCKYHVCHISTKEGVELIRQAKKDGLDVTCETAPHYLILDDGDLREDGYFKMNPPLRSKEDKEALIAGILDKTIDMIATDHAPHAEDEKNKGLKDSVFGIVGLETAFPLMYTYFVKTGLLTLEDLVDLMANKPRKRFNIKFTDIYYEWDLDAEYRINPDDFKSKGRATPFVGTKVYGKIVNSHK
jgi:dihydroorotase